MPLPAENVIDIRSMGAVADDMKFDNAPIINKALEQAEKIGGTVLVAGGRLHLHNDFSAFKCNAFY